jgi:bacterioferritin-associated ferredoxin
MYLCICKTVSDQQIREAIREGVRTVGEVSARFGAGTECGKCLDDLRGYVDACLAELPAASAISDPAPMAIAKPAPPPVTNPAPAPAAWFAIDL